MSSGSGALILKMARPPAPPPSKFVPHLDRKCCHFPFCVFSNLSWIPIKSEPWISTLLSASQLCRLWRRIHQRLCRVVRTRGESSGARFTLDASCVASASGPNGSCVVCGTARVHSHRDATHDSPSAKQTWQTILILCNIFVPNTKSKLTEHNYVTETSYLLILDSMLWSDVYDKFYLLSSWFFVTLHLHQCVHVKQKI